MFKTDEASLEVLSFAFDEKEIATLRRLFELLRRRELLTIETAEITRAIEGLETIGQLKLEGKVYGFEVQDDCAEERSGNGLGVELYLRQGNTLGDFLIPSTRDEVFGIDRAATFLRERGIATIYTGSIDFQTGFLGIPYECDKDHPLRRDGLCDHDRAIFEGHGITVTWLDHLI